MIKSHKAFGRQALKYAMAGIAVSCLGAAVFAAPMTITPRLMGHRSTPAKPKRPMRLVKGPAFHLGRAAAGEDEDCVRVTRMVGPDGRVYVTRGLICQARVFSRGQREGALRGRAEGEGKVRRFKEFFGGGHQLEPRQADRRPCGGQRGRADTRLIVTNLKVRHHRVRHGCGRARARPRKQQG